MKNKEEIERLDKKIEEDMNDPELPKNINTLTLSYTLYDVSDRVVKQSKNEKRIA